MADSEQVHRSPCEANSNWGSEEYEAGCWSGYHGVTEFQSATHSWRAGWQDAQRELHTMGANSLPVVEEDIVPTQWSLYGAGAVARAYGLPFDEERSDWWKRSWIHADIDIRLKEREQIRA